MKFSGKLGYVMTGEQAGRPGIYTPVAVEKSATGDMERGSYESVANSDAINDIVFKGRISIVVNKFITENFQYIKYVIYKGNKWEVKSAELSYPRIYLTLGGVYHG